MSDSMTFPDTVEEFMEQYKVVDTEQVYTNGTEFVPIFRMKQWFQHKPERKKGRWGHISDSDSEYLCCSQCGYLITVFDNHIDVFPRLKDIKNVPYCPNCGAEMEGQDE